MRPRTPLRGYGAEGSEGALVAPSPHPSDPSFTRRGSEGGRMSPLLTNHSRGGQQTPLEPT